jgi:hypothetical protein
MPSTVIADIRYDAEHKKLRIEFVSGMVYEYLDVPAETAHSLKTAGSKGSYLNRHIKGHFAYRRLS